MGSIVCSICGKTIKHSCLFEGILYCICNEHFGIKTSKSFDYTALRINNYDFLRRHKMICIDCDKNFPDNYKYCPFCGNELWENFDEYHQARVLDEKIKNQTEGLVVEFTLNERK